jgi:hypothetical protein
MERIVATVIVFIALFAALLLGWRQWKQWHWYKANRDELSAEDQRYFRWSLGRRIAGCILLFILAAMVYGIYAFDIASGLDQLVQQAEKNRDGKAHLNDDQKAFFLMSWNYVICLLLLVMVLFVLAGWDIYAIRRYGQRHRRRIRDDRRAMLERQLPILYAERRAQQPGYSDDLPAL